MLIVNSDNIVFGLIECASEDVGSGSVEADSVMHSCAPGARRRHNVHYEFDPPTVVAQLNLWGQIVPLGERR